MHKNQISSRRNREQWPQERSGVFVFPYRVDKDPLKLDTLPATAPPPISILSLLFLQFLKESETRNCSSGTYRNTWVKADIEVLPARAAESSLYPTSFPFTLFSKSSLPRVQVPQAAEDSSFFFPQKTDFWSNSAASAPESVSVLKPVDFGCCKRFLNAGTEFTHIRSRCYIRISRSIFAFRQTKYASQERWGNLHMVQFRL